MDHKSVSKHQVERSKNDRTIPIKLYVQIELLKITHPQDTRAFQRSLLEYFLSIEIYEKKKEVEESILSGKIDEAAHLISLFESQGKQQEIKLLLAKAGLCIDYLTN